MMKMATTLDAKYGARHGGDSSMWVLSSWVTRLDTRETLGAYSTLIYNKGGDGSCLCHWWQLNKDQLATTIVYAVGPQTPVIYACRT